MVAKALTGKVNASIKEANKDGTWYDWIDENTPIREDHPKIHFYYSCISMRRSHRAGAANVLGIPHPWSIARGRRSKQDEDGCSMRWVIRMEVRRASITPWLTGRLTSRAAASLNPFETCETQARQY